MLNDKFNLEIDEEFLELFYELANELPPSKNAVTVEDLKRIVAKLQNNGTIHHQHQQQKEDLFGTFANPEENTKSVLIVDDLGTITYQLSAMYTRLGYTTQTSKEIYDAISKYKKQHFDLVILDLFIPTEREGFLLLDEILKLNDIRPRKSIIGIITGSTRREHKQACRDKGAAFYIEKVAGWQKNLIDICEQISKQNF